MPADSDSIVLRTASGQVVLHGGEPCALPGDAGAVLLRLARAAIAAELRVGEAARHDDTPWLHRQGASFITLKRDSRLRGCIGTLRAHRALGEDVRLNAVGAAFRDPRFSPLTPQEFDGLSVEISVLSALEPMRFADEADALRQLRVGTDGLVFEYGRHTSTFLPQVWDDLKEPADFLAHLKYKAGLPPDFWDAEVKLSRYTVYKWREER